MTDAASMRYVHRLASFIADEICKMKTTCLRFAVNTAHHAFAMHVMSKIKHNNRIMCWIYCFDHATLINKIEIHLSPQFLLENNNMHSKLQIEWLGIHVTCLEVR